MQKNPILIKINYPSLLGPNRKIKNIQAKFASEAASVGRTPPKVEVYFLLVNDVADSSNGW